MTFRGHVPALLLMTVVLAFLAGCAAHESARRPMDPVRSAQRDESVSMSPPAKATRPHASTRAPARPSVRALQGPGLLEHLLPASVTDRAGWTSDIYMALSAMEIPQTVENSCAVIATIEQESDFRADPSIPGLPDIAWREIDKQSERIGMPKLVVQKALKMQSSDGKTYSERLDTVQTERQLSELFEDFIGRVPLGKTFFAARNPVRTGGPMQVSVGFAEKHIASKKYPYAVSESIRHEVFTRRGGIYFGIAHLLDYPASYDSHIFRFADYNAGQYASRNAAFQSALTVASGTVLTLDGDLLRYDHGQAVAQPSNTELATRSLAARLEMSASDIRRDLERGTTPDFERTRLFARVFALADKVNGKPVPRAVVPAILLNSPKFTRKLTTESYASRVAGRHKRCLARAAEMG
jgi:hypothetical protein